MGTMSLVGDIDTFTLVHRVVGCQSHLVACKLLLGIVLVEQSLIHSACPDACLEHTA